VEAFLNMKTKLENINEWVNKAFPENSFMIPDGFEDAFMGVAIQFNKPIAIIDYDKCLNILLKDGMSYHEAEEYMEFNVIDAYVGENTPAFLFKYKNYEISRNTND